MLRIEQENLARKICQELKMSNKPLAKFKTKSGREIEIWQPSMDRLPALLEFVNRLVKEDTFLSLTGQPKSFAEEKTWLENAIAGMKAEKSFLVWAIFGEKIIGSCDIVHGATPRDWHVGKIGIMVDRDFRREGIGQFLLEFILRKASQMNIQIATMDVFSDNEPAISLYQKLGFREWARLPNGFYRQGKYSDAVKMYKKL